MDEEHRHHLIQVAILFLRLGITAFGGPAAHIALMRDEAVRRRRWLDDERFLDLFGAANMIPGPSSTEMAISLGYLRAGWPGLIVAGVCFILPAMLIVLAFAWAYVRFGSAPQVGAILYGIKPIVIAIIVQALWALGRKAVKGPLTAAIGLGVLALYLAGVNEIVLLLLGGAVAMVAGNRGRLKWMGLGVLIAPSAGIAIPVLGATPFSLAILFVTFFKIGAVLFGSGYVLLAFLRADFVTRLGWLTDRQLIDAVAIGQVTPGPVFTTATFIGYLLGGVPGALLATLGIFLPSFFFVGLVYPLIPRIRGSSWAGAALDGINVASLGLMAAVTWLLGQSSIVDPLTLALALVASVLLLRFKINATWLIALGALAGLATGLGYAR